MKTKFKRKQKTEKINRIGYLDEDSLRQIGKETIVRFNVTAFDNEADYIRIEHRIEPLQFISYDIGGCSRGNVPIEKEDDLESAIEEMRKLADSAKGKPRAEYGLKRIRLLDKYNQETPIFTLDHSWGMPIKRSWGKRLFAY